MPYATISLDPPWMEQGGGKSVRGAQRHYGLMPTYAMPRLILQARMPDGSYAWDPHPDAHVYMHATKNFLGDAIWLMGALGVRHVTDFTWVKIKERAKGPSSDPASWLRAGIGQYGRGCKEHLLFGVMQGSKNVTHFRSERKDILDVFFSYVGEHSEKPVESYELIEARSLCPDDMERMEFFARSGRDGWRAWGNEAPGEEDVLSEEDVLESEEIEVDLDPEVVPETLGELDREGSTPADDDDWL